MAYKPPKTVKMHQAVLHVCSGDDEGSDQKHWVDLKDGWVFENGRAANCTSLSFDRVSDFVFANPLFKGIA